MASENEQATNDAQLPNGTWQSLHPIAEHDPIERRWSGPVAAVRGSPGLRPAVGKRDFSDWKAEEPCFWGRASPTLHIPFDTYKRESRFGGGKARQSDHLAQKELGNNDFAQAGEEEAGRGGPFADGLQMRHMAQTSW